ncbi:hypothetical protein HY988_00490 [Candidatus Micrarchaeota archaeon]|nr:hypothetical protein [Candidatus Micrarchaeota archaeon]
MNSFRKLARASITYVETVARRVFGGRSETEHIAGPMEQPQSVCDSLIPLPAERHLRYMLEHGTLAASEIGVTFCCPNFDQEPVLGQIFAKAVQDSYSAGTPLGEVRVDLSYLGKRNARSENRSEMHACGNYLDMTNQIPLRCD